MIRQILFDTLTVGQLLVDVRQDRYAAWDVVLTTAENNSGELTLTIASDHPAAELLCPMKTEIYVEDNENETWRGRLISRNRGLKNRIKLTVKGIADYLHDTVVQVGIISGATASAALAAILTAHNAACEELGKRFSVGTVTVEATVDFDGTQHQSPWDILASLAKKYGGRIVGRNDPATGIRYIDWMSTEMSDLVTCAQTLEYGVNLLSLEDRLDGSELVTRLYGYGKTVNGVPVTVESVNGGVPYIEDTDAIAAFGVIAGVLNRGDETDPVQLLQTMREELKMRLEDARDITANAVDLYDVGQEVEPFAVGQKVHTIAAPLYMDVMLRATKIQRNLFRPKNTKITFGASTRYASSMIRR